MRKNHCVFLDDDVLTCAQLCGLENLSEFVRDALNAFISETGEELTKSQIREIAKKYALMKRASLQQQQKIVGQTDEEKQKIENFREKRLSCIISSVKVEVDRIGPERFKKYMDDPFEDFSTIQDDIIASVSERSGYSVDLADVIRAFKVVPS